MAFVTWITPRALAVICATGFAQTAVADTVQLHSRDGLVHITGHLLSNENGLYNVETELGSVLVSARHVFCLGVACPRPDDIQPDPFKAGGMATTAGSGPSNNPALYPPTVEPLG